MRPLCVWAMQWALTRMPIEGIGDVAGDLPVGGSVPVGAAKAAIIVRNGDDGDEGKEGGNVGKSGGGFEGGNGKKGGDGGK